MQQIVTTDYDFKKTYYRNFYDNRKAGMVKGSKYGKLARKIHAEFAPNDSRYGTVWDKDTETWVAATENYIGGVGLVESYKWIDWYPE